MVHNPDHAGVKWWGGGETLLAPPPSCATDLNMRYSNQHIYIYINSKHGYGFLKSMENCYLSF